MTKAASETDARTLERILQAQRTAFLAERPEKLSVRRDRIERAIALLRDHGETLADAMNADFGGRSREGSMMTDIVGTIGFGRYCVENMDEWTATDRRSVRFPLALMGAKAEVRYEPKGVVGILSPWNFPVNLSFGPLMQVLAAGNRAMIKPSELTPATSDRMRELIAQAFDESEVAVVTGGPDTAQAFSALPFDHLVFTGSTETGRKVMAAAAKNLTPVTLELGGKSPAIIGAGADLTRAGERIAQGKMLNAGQICLAPDYVLVPEDQEEGVVAAIQLGVHEMYPTLLNNPDYTAIVSDRHFDRLKALVEDARSKGAEVIEVNPDDEDFSALNARKMPLTILRNVTEDMTAMREEIFGPVLPVKTYRRIDEAIDYVNGRDRPLGLYYFGGKSKERERVLQRTISGGVTINDVLFHITADDLPFGGTGASGMGSYHGREGFREFSHARSIYTQPKIDVSKLAGFKPPYGDTTKKAIEREMK